MITTLLDRQKQEFVKDWNELIERLLSCCNFEIIEGYLCRIVDHGADGQVIDDIIKVEKIEKWQEKEADDDKSKK